MEARELKLESVAYTLTSAADLNVAATSTTWTMTNLFGGNLTTGYIVGIYGRIVTPFAGIAGPLWMEIGDAVKTDSIMPRISLMVAKANQVLFSHFPMDFPVVACEQFPLYRYSMTAPIVTFTSSSGNLEDLTGGIVELVLINLR